MAGNQTDNVMLLDLTTGLPRIPETGGTPDTIQLSVDMQLISGANMLIDGDLTVNGTTTTVHSEIVNINDNHLYLNADYTTAVAQDGGIVINVLPTATTDTVAATGFTAGVPATSNPTVDTTGAATFSPGDIVQISGANNQTNDGIFEVLSHAANVLTIRGVGTTSTTVDWVQNDFVTDTTVAGAITLINVNVLQGTSTGVWQTVTTSSTTGLTYNQVTTQGVVDLQEAYEQGNTITTDAGNGNVVITGSEELLVTTTGGINLDTIFDADVTTFDVQMTGTNGFSIDGTAASNVTVDQGVLTLSTTTSGDIAMAAADAITIDAGDEAAAVGNAVTVTGGDGGGANNGGAVNLVGGASGAGATGNGGAINVTAGSATSTDGDGGIITLTAGSNTGTGAEGYTDITGTQGETEPVLQLSPTGTNAQTVQVFTGTNSPNGVVTADAGSLFLRDTGSGGEVWVNDSTGSGTSWTQLSTAAGATLQSAYEAGNTITTSATEGDITFTGTEDFIVTLSDLLVDTTNSISLDAVVSSNFTVTANTAGPQDLTLSATNAGAGAGNVLVSADDEIDLTSGGLMDFNAGANLDIDVTGTFDMLSTGAFSIDGTGASNVTADTGGLTVSTTTSGTLLLDAVALLDVNAGANMDIDVTGTFDMLSTGAFSIDGAGASNVTTDTGTLTLSTTTSGNVDVTAADAVNVTAGNEAATTGNAVNVTAGDGGGANDGGAVVVTGGTSGAGATGNGGAVTITAGSAASTDGDGGVITLMSGSNTGTGAEGFIHLTGTQAETEELVQLTTTGTNGDSVQFFVGDNSPNGSVDGLAGSVFFRDTGTTGELWINTSTTSGTTWQQVVTAGSGTLSLQTAYEGGNTITTSATEGDITFTGTEDFIITLSDLLVDTTNSISLDAVVSSNFTVTANSAGAENLVLSATNAGAGSGNVLISADDEIDLTSTGLMDLNAGANLDIDVTGTFDMLSTGAFSIDGTGASNVSATSGNLTLSTITTGTVDITSADDIQMTFETNNATAMVIDDGTNNFITFDSTTGDLAIEMNQFVDITGDGVGITLTAAATIAIGDLVSLDSAGDVILADANTGTDTDAYCIGVAATAATATNPVRVYATTGDLVPVNFAAAPGAATNGSIVFVSVTGGQGSITPPAGGGSVVYKIGILQGADGADTSPLVLFQPQFLAKKP